MTAAPLPAPKLRTFEALRGVAAFLVVVAHAPGAGPGHWQLPVSGGGLAVEFFFVLSGFVMAMIHGGEIGRGRRAIPGFLWARARRVYPMLWVVLLLLALVPGERPASPWTWIDWATLEPVAVNERLGVVWTLQLEVLFYALLALAMLPRVGWPLLAGWALLSPILKSWYPAVADLIPRPVWEHPSFWHFLWFGPDFLVGLGAGLVFRRVTLPPWAVRAAVALGVAVIAARLPYERWGFAYGPFTVRYLYAGGFALILLGCACAERAGRWRLGRWALALGGLSYPLYLVHPVVIDLVIRAPLPAVGPLDPGQVGTALAIAASLAAGAALAFLVDRPIQKMLRRLRPERKPAFA